MRELKNVIWGSFLILIGVLLLLERFGTLHLPAGSAWPLILFAFAAIAAVDRRVKRAIVLFVLGLICLCASLNWLGFSYAHGWPVLLVAAGLGIIINAFGGRPRGRGNREVTS